MNLNHLEEAEETYSQHLHRALIMSFNLFIMTLVCLIHALLPFIFTTYVSRRVMEINSSLDSLKIKEI